MTLQPPPDAARQAEGAELLSLLERADRHVLWVMKVDPVERVDYVSPAVERVWGRPPEAFHADAHLWVSSIHPEDQPAVAAAYEHWLGDPMNRRYEVEFRVVRPDGSVRWVHDSGTAVLDGQGRPVRLSGIAEDITERKLDLEALQDERARLGAIAATAPTIVHSFHTGADGRMWFELGAARVAELFGVTEAEVRTDALAMFERIVEPADHVRTGELARASARDLTPWRAEYRLRHPQRGTVWVEGHSMPMRGPDGSTVWHGALTDITERKLTEQALRDSQAHLNAELEARVAERTAELQAAVKELEAFSYSVSHDLRAPLRALDGFSQALVEDHGKALPEEGRRYLGIIRETAQKMGRLIDDLLNFARLSRQSLTRRPVDHDKLVKHAWDGLAAQREGRSVRFVCDPLPPGEGDLALLRQVWINLLSNAVKYSRQREEAVVEVGSVARDDGRIEYFVRDNGAGFDMRYAHKLFGVFERLHRAEEFEGTGVGLAIVQRIVTRHGGAVRAEAVPDRGAAFYFTLG